MLPVVANDSSQLRKITRGMHHILFTSPPFNCHPSEDQSDTTYHICPNMSVANLKEEFKF